MVDFLTKPQTKASYLPDNAVEGAYVYNSYHGADYTIRVLTTRL